jgi:exosome complex exonuclease RRP6
MMHYARTDTHYLLYVYDQLRNALLSMSGGNQDRIREVLDRSAATALQVYQIEEYNTETGNGVFGWRSLARKFFGIKTSGPKTEAARNTLMWGHGKVGLQVETVFRRVHEWRDRVARELDESTG